MSKTLNHLRTHTGAMTLHDFHQAASRAQNRPLEIKQGQLVVTPPKRYGWSGKIYRFFHSIAEVFKRSDRRESFLRQQRQSLANECFRSLVSVQGVPKSEYERFNTSKVLTGNQVKEIIDATDYKLMCCQRAAERYIDRNPEKELEAFRLAFKTYHGMDVWDFIGIKKPDHPDEEREVLSDTPVWKAYKKNLNALTTNFALRASTQVENRSSDRPMDSLQGPDEDEIQSAIGNATRLAAAFSLDSGQADMYSRGFQGAEQALTRFFTEAAEENPDPKKLSNVLSVSGWVLRKALLMVV